MTCKLPTRDLQQLPSQIKRHLPLLQPTPEHVRKATKPIFCQAKMARPPRHKQAKDNRTEHVRSLSVAGQLSLKPFGAFAPDCNRQALRLVEP
jgi:hypothetical protein